MNGMEVVCSDEFVKEVSRKVGGGENECGSGHEIE